MSYITFTDYIELTGTILPGPRTDLRQPNRHPDSVVLRSEFRCPRDQNLWQWVAYGHNDAVVMVIEMPWDHKTPPDPLDRKKSLKCRWGDDALWQLRDIVSWQVRSDVRSAV